MVIMARAVVVSSVAVALHPSLFDVLHLDEFPALALIVAVRLRHIPGIPSCQVLLPVLCVTTTFKLLHLLYRPL